MPLLGGHLVPTKMEVQGKKRKHKMKMSRHLLSTDPLITGNKWVYQSWERKERLLLVISGFKCFYMLWCTVSKFEDFSAVLWSLHKIWVIKNKVQNFVWNLLKHGIFSHEELCTDANRMTHFRPSWAQLERPKSSTLGSQTHSREMGRFYLLDTASPCATAEYSLFPVQTNP